MAVIFIGSTDLGSSQRTSRIIGPILRWFKPDVSDATVHAVQAVVRKGAHVTVYAVLAILAWRALRVAKNEGWKRWKWNEAWLILAFCACYAVTDEVHQAFVSTRQGHPLDVLLDSFGALCGLLLIWGVGKKRNCW